MAERNAAADARFAGERLASEVHGFLEREDRYDHGA